MVRECTNQDREMLFEYLKREPVYNTFMLADIEDFGFDEPFQTVYVDEEQGVCRSVYLCFYKTFLVYSQTDEVNMPFLEQLFGYFVPDVVMGKKEVVQLVQRILTDYTMETRTLFLMEHPEKLEPETAAIEKAKEEDAEAIFQFLQSIPELRHLYTSKEMIADRIARDRGNHYMIRKDGQLIAHGNSTAECEATTMIGGVATAQQVRGNGLAGQIVSRLCREILEKNKKPCLFSMRGETDNLYNRIGFEKVGEWASLSRMTAEKPTEGSVEEPAAEETKKLPSYIPVYNQLYEDIINGVYEKDSLLPSENVLSERYHVSRNTLRQALTILNQDGYIYKQQGKGTFVSYDKEKELRQREKLYNYLIEDALEPITKMTPDHNVGTPTRIAKEKLKLAEGEHVLASNNVYEDGSGAVGQSFLQIPLKVLEGAGVDRTQEEALTAFMNKGIYEISESAECMVQLMEADEQVIPYLGVPEGTPLLHFEQLLFDRDRKPTARIKYYFISGKYQIRFQV